MPKNVIMPALGMAQETGILLQWLKSEGAVVAQGEPLMEIETDKATVEVEAPASGTLANITANPGDEIPVGQIIALILAPGEAAAPVEDAAKPVEVMAADPTPSGQTEALASPVAARIAAEHNVDLKSIEPTGSRSGSRIHKEDVLAYLAAQQAVETTDKVGRRILASPKARRLASARDLDLALIDGSGPEGAVLAADVESYRAPVQPIPIAEPEAVTPAAALQTLATSRMWRVAAERLTESWQTVPHFFLVREINAKQLIVWREKVSRPVGPKITYTDLLVKIVAEALSQHPRLNASWQNGEIIRNPDVNIGLAVAVEDGLLVPVIHQANTLSLSEIASQRQALVERAQSGKSTLTDLEQGTFTLTNLGMYGVDAFKAIINPPQAAILATGRIADRVVPVNGQPAVQPMITLSLSCDHRTVDGARGAQFLQTVADFIEEPLKLL